MSKVCKHTMKDLLRTASEIFKIHLKAFKSVALTMEDPRSSKIEKHFKMLENAIDGKDHC